jgi:hypothetical protein
MSLLFLQLSCSSLQDLKGRQFFSHIEPRHQQHESRQITRGWLESSTHHKYCSCGTHNMFRWDPRAGPTWIHEIFAWDPHQVGPTHFGLWGSQFYWVGFLSLINLNRGFCPPLRHICSKTSAMGSRMVLDGSDPFRRLRAHSYKKNFTLYRN